MPFNLGKVLHGDLAGAQRLVRGRERTRTDANGRRTGGWKRKRIQETARLTDFMSDSLDRPDSLLEDMINVAEQTFSPSKQQVRPRCIMQDKKHGKKAPAEMPWQQAGSVGRFIGQGIAICLQFDASCKALTSS